MPDNSRQLIEPPTFSPGNAPSHSASIKDLVLRYKAALEAACFIGAVLVFRLPFLGPGYGAEPDAWRVAIAAKQIAATGEYSWSRMMGNPLQEIVYSLFWNTGPHVFNFTTACLSVLGALFFALTLKRLCMRDYFIAALSLAYTPIVFINSVNSMDYIWALSFILGSQYFVLRKRPVLAGVLLGCAIGCRVTSGALLLPFALSQIEFKEKRINYREILSLGISTCLVGGLLYYPVYCAYGIGFFGYYDVTLPTVQKVIWRITHQIFGYGGLIAIGLSILVSIALAYLGSKQTTFLEKTQKKHLISWIVAIVLYTIAFLKYPTKSAFLIPAIPFVFLLLGRFLHRKVFRVLCVLIIISSFIGKKQLELIHQKTGIPILSLSYGLGYGGTEQKIEAIKKSLLILGRIFKKEKRAEKIVSFMNLQEKDLKSYKITNNNLYVGGMGFKGAHGITSSEKHYPPFELLGIKNSLTQKAKSNHIFIQKESLLAQNPNIIFLDMFGKKIIKEDLKAHKTLYKSLSAYKNNQIHWLLAYNFYNTNITNVYINSWIILQKLGHDIDIESKMNQIYSAFYKNSTKKLMKSRYPIKSFNAKPLN